MGLEGTSERLSALANLAGDHLDCELIHKGVTTQAARILAAPTHHWSVDQQLDAAVPSRHSPHSSPIDRPLRQRSTH